MGIGGDAVILVDNDGKALLAVFAAATEPIGMFEAVDAAIWPTSKMDDTYRWGCLMGLILNLVRQGCLRVVGTGDSLRGDKYEITDVGRRIVESTRRTHD